MQSKFAIRYGSLSSWNFWTIFWVLGIRFILAMTIDPTRTDNFSPLWFVAWLLSTLAMGAFVWLVMILGLQKRLERKPSPTANIITVSAAGILGNLLIAAMALAWGIDHEQIWIVRIIGAILIHLGIFLGVNGLRATVIERRERIRKLLETEDQLQGYRESAKQIVADEFDRLKQQSMDVLIPHIDNIEQLIATRFDNDARENLLNELSVIISNEVRPLSRAIANEGAALSEFKSPIEAQPSRRINWNSTFVLRNGIRPIALGGLMIPTFGAMEFMMVSHGSALRGYLGGLGVMVVLALTKAVLPRKKEIKTIAGTFVLVAIAAVSVIPAWYFMWFEYRFDPIWYLTAAAEVVCVVLALFMIGYIRASDNAAERYEASLEVANQALAKEVALFEQKLALNRRNWSRIIHGDVQAALSAAVTRLRRSAEPEPYEYELVKQDLARAKDALHQRTGEQPTFEALMASLTGAWGNVCAITVSASARAKRALDASPDARSCVNEICKEAISNAVRHGDAKHATITLDRDQDDLLTLSVTNDGAPKSANSQPGMGSQLIEELTLSWSLTSANGQARLDAVIPLQTH